MKIVFMGTPNFAVPILKALHEKYDVVLVVSQPDRAKKKNQLIKTPYIAAIFNQKATFDNNVKVRLFLSDKIEFN